ncbi:Potassium voltage-gated channel protein eag [Taenia crassiceps]|uniref:Potassium voltage-gated channel protein eag n=1 Tax=Taenia crassiceps TaxID=6207 RepID=A0ABR4QCV6_9CEST
MSGTRRGLVAPQNTFLEKIIRRCNGQFQSFLLTNARIVDYPIVYCNEGFAKMTGYSRVDIMQKSGNCSYLYGEQTTQEMRDRLMQALDNQTKEQLEILLYKKNRTPLWLMIYIAPVVNERAETVLMLLTFRDITALKTPLDDDESNKAGLNKFARLARSVTRNRTMLQQVATATPTPQPNTVTSSDWNLLTPEVADNRHGRARTPSSTRTPSSHFGDEHGIPSTTPKAQADLEKGTATFASWMDVVPPYKQEAPKTPPHVILHYVAFKTAWDWMILFLTGYTAVMVPFNAAFRSKTIDDVIFLVIDSIVDVIFFIDIVLNFHTTFVGPQGEVISDATVIRINYLKGWFIVDLLSCLPYDVFNAFQPEATQSTISSLFSALKVVRLLRIGRVTRKLDQYLEYMAASLFLMIFGFVLLAHWLACIWYSIGMSDLENFIHYGWIPRLSSDIGLTSKNYSLFDAKNISVSRSMTYITALYYTLSLITSIGFGNVSANTFGEKIVSVIFMLIGAFSYATIFGQITTIFQGMYAARSRYHDMMGSVKDFVKTHNVPQDLAERVIDYVTSTWAITKGIDTAKVLNYCPKDMKADLCIHLNRMVFNEHPAFRLASDGCLRSLAVNFNTLHTAPGDLIFHQGESIDQLCFVVTGSLEVIQDDEIVAILGRGDIFGEPFWKDPSRMSHSSATVRALTYCDLHYIKKDRLLHVLDFYTAFANSFARNLVLSYDLKTRLIFRKLEDVRRERELAEHRTNENYLSELTADHPVRRMIHRFRKIGTANANAAAVAAATSNAGGGGSRSGGGEGGEGSGGSEERSSLVPGVVVAPQRKKSIGGLEPADSASEPSPASPASMWARLKSSGSAASSAGGGGSGGGEKSEAPGETKSENLTHVNPPTVTNKPSLSTTGLQVKRTLQSQTIVEEDESVSSGKATKAEVLSPLIEKKIQSVLEAISVMRSSVVDEITAVNRRIDMIDDHLLKLYEAVGKVIENQKIRTRQPSGSDGAESVSSILRLFRKGSPPTKERVMRKTYSNFVEMQHLSSSHSKRSAVALGISKKGRGVKSSKVGPTVTETELIQARVDDPLVFYDRCADDRTAGYLRTPKANHSTLRSPSYGGSRFNSRSPVPSRGYEMLLGSGDGLSSLSTLGGEDQEEEMAFQIRAQSTPVPLQPQLHLSQPPPSRRSNGGKSLYTQESSSRNSDSKRDTVVRSSSSKGVDFDTQWRLEMNPFFIKNCGTVTSCFCFLAQIQSFWRYRQSCSFHGDFLPLRS